MFHPPVFLCSCLSAPEARRHDALPEHVVLRPVRSIWNISRIFPVLARLSPGGSDLFWPAGNFSGAQRKQASSLARAISAAFRNVARGLRRPTQPEKNHALPCRAYHHACFHGRGPGRRGPTGHKRGEWPETSTGNAAVLHRTVSFPAFHWCCSCRVPENAASRGCCTWRQQRRPLIQTHLGHVWQAFLSGSGSGSTPTGLYGFKDFRVIYSQKKKKRKLL
jgi:hypothetical protein